MKPVKSFNLPNDTVPNEPTGQGQSKEKESDPQVVSSIWIGDRTANVFSATILFGGGTEVVIAVVAGSAGGHPLETGAEQQQIERDPRTNQVGHHRRRRRRREATVRTQRTTP